MNVVEERMRCMLFKSRLNSKKILVKGGGINEKIHCRSVNAPDMSYCAHLCNTSPDCAIKEYVL